MNCRPFGLGIAASLALATTALAAPHSALPMSPFDDGLASFEALSVSASTPDGRSATWTAPQNWTGGGDAIDLRDPSGSLLGSFRLGNESFRNGGGPSIAVSFSVIAGPTDTTFSIGSALLSFSPIDTCGRLSGSVHIQDMPSTDPNRGDAGVTYTGQLANGDSFGGYYEGYTTAGTLAASGLPFLSAGPGGEASDSFDSGCRELGIVSNISALISFKLTAFDKANGGLAWELGCCTVPLPTGAAMGLAGVGLIAGVRRRRSS